MGVQSAVLVGPACTDPTMANDEMANTAINSFLMACTLPQRDHAAKGG
jgi:hypothetical protein